MCAITTPCNSCIDYLISGPEYIRNPNFTNLVTVYILESSDARPLAGIIITTNRHTFSRFLWLSNNLNPFSLVRWFSLKWPTQCRKISRHLGCQFRVISWYELLVCYWLHCVGPEQNRDYHWCIKLALVITVNLKLLVLDRNLERDPPA